MQITQLSGRLRHFAGTPNVLSMQFSAVDVTGIRESIITIANACKEDDPQIAQQLLTAKDTFQDGNGRVGRLIALKECLRFNIVPFLIEDSKKTFYYRGLSEWENEKGWLTDTCLDGQDTFKRLLAMFDL